MADIDSFATSLFEEAKRFLEKGEGDTDSLPRDAHLHAAMMLAFCSLEAHVNSIAEEFAQRPEFTMHEKAILLEKDARLEDGEFVLRSFKMFRLEDRIQFLHRKFSGKPFDGEAIWWSRLKDAMLIRNKLTHPKDAHPLTTQNVRDALTAIIAVLDATYVAIYKKGFPAAGRGLHSQLSF
jgi:hypothetical protein